jgi:single-stranded-DNA-specific exonuclease
METNEIIDVILADRGVEDSMALLYPNEDCLVPFEKMRNTDKAAKIITKNIENDGSFFVHFDCDVDGISAGSIAVRWLRNHTDRVSYGINQGKEHGIANLDLELLKDVDVLWIVDSIETKMFPYERILKDWDGQIIITDHHLLSTGMQKQMERTGQITLVSSAVDYPNPALSGSATTWKLCAYMDWLELDDYSDDLVDLACAGLVADMCDVGVESPENRYICYKGFSNQINPALKKINGSYEFNSGAVSFGVAPLINAANRLSENEKAMNLFLSENSKEITKLVNDLKSCKEYQNLEIADVMPELEAQAESQMDKKVMFFFVETNAEVKGLIGNKLLEKYQRPVIVLSNRITVNEETGEVEKHEYFGSARAVGVKNFKEYVDNTGLVGSGGHENAHGIWFDAEVLEDFQNALEDALKDVEFVQETTVDIQIDQEQITDDLIRQLKTLNRISGQGWPQISVMVSGITDYEVGQMSGGKHLKFIIENGKTLLIKWNCSSNDFPAGELSAIGTLDSGFFGRTYYKQLIMSDFKIG